MRALIVRIRAELPFDSPRAQVCTGQCEGCSQKLLEYLGAELDAWERRLADGGRPGLDDLSRLIRTSRRIHRVLERNGLVTASRQGGGVD